MTTGNFIKLFMFSHSDIWKGRRWDRIKISRTNGWRAFKTWAYVLREHIRFQVRLLLRTTTWKISDELAKWVRVVVKTFPQLILGHRILFFDKRIICTWDRRVRSQGRNLYESDSSRHSSRLNQVFGVILDWPFDISVLSTISSRYDLLSSRHITENDKKLSLNPKTNIYLSKFEPTPYSVKLHGLAKCDCKQRVWYSRVFGSVHDVELHYLALSKLAPVQVHTWSPRHVRIPRDIMDYYLSWNGFAGESSTFLHRDACSNSRKWCTVGFFEPRTENGTSLIAGSSIRPFRQKSLAENVVWQQGSNGDVHEPQRKYLFLCSGTVQVSLYIWQDSEKILNKTRMLDRTYRNAWCTWCSSVM